MEKLRAGALSTFRIEKRYIRKEGGALSVRLTVMPLWAPGLDPDFHLAIVEDITERKRAEATLREHRRFQATRLDNLPGAVYRCRNDRNWTMDFISDGIAALTGYPAADFRAGRRLYGQDIIFPDDQNKVWIEVQAALDVRRPFQLLYRILTVQKEVKWVWEQGRGIFSSEGAFLAAFLAIEGFITDMTQRKEAEDALRESEKRLRLAVDAANVGLWDWELGTDCVRYSPEWKHQIGYADAEIADRFEEWESRSARGSPAQGRPCPRLGHQSRTEIRGGISNPAQGRFLSLDTDASRLALRYAGKPRTDDGFAHRYYRSQKNGGGLEYPAH